MAVYRNERKSVVVFDLYERPGEPATHFEVEPGEEVDGPSSYEDYFRRKGLTLATGQAEKPAKKAPAKAPDKPPDRPADRPAEKPPVPTDRKPPVPPPFAPIPLPSEARPGSPAEPPPAGFGAWDDVDDTPEAGPKKRSKR
jgi:hypothetical protein